MNKVLEFKPKEPPPEWEFVCDCGSATFRLVREDSEPAYCAECTQCGIFHLVALQA